MSQTQNILITGGAGFIGSHLVDALLSEQQTRITVVDDFNNFYDPQIKIENLRQHALDPRLEIVRADICNFAQLTKLFAARRFDCIVHLAARAGVRPSLAEPQLYARTNINGTLNLLELARHFAVEQFVFGSSSSVYGATNKVPFVEEDDVSRPISPYAATKAAGEQLCYTYSHLYNLRAVCLRFFTVYGARQRPDLAIHKFARLISENAPVPLYGDGRTRRDYTFIGDIVNGIRAAINYRASSFEIFNLGNSHTVELLELVRLLEYNLAHKATIDWQPAQPGDVPQTFADVNKARQLLGYCPTINIEEGVARFAKWFKTQRGKSSEARENKRDFVGFAAPTSAIAAAVY